MLKTIRVAFLLFAVSVSLPAQTAKPRLTLDEFFNSVDFTSVKVSPDGGSVLIGTTRADWDQKIYRKELWLSRIADAGGTLVQLTSSGRDYSPQWSPDGRRIAFLSERKSVTGEAGISGEDDHKQTAQLFLISVGGGEAFAATTGEEDVHAFAWSSDSKAIYFATRQPWSKDQNDEHKKEWKDVTRYRADERGDTIFRISVDDVLGRQEALGAREIPKAERASGSTPESTAVVQAALRVSEMTISRDGARLAFMSSSVSERQE